MGAFMECIVATGRFSRNYGELLTKEIKPEQFARKPRFEGAKGVVVVDTNHPAFVFGHLGLYLARAFALTGGDGKHVEPPAGWTDLFKAGAACKDDVEGTIYPAMAEILGHYFKATDATLEYLKGVPDDVLGRENPNESFRARMPTVGAVLAFYLGGHAMMHLGQVSAWRRCMGMPSAM